MLELFGMIIPKLVDARRNNLDVLLKDSHRHKFGLLPHRCNLSFVQHILVILIVHLLFSFAKVLVHSSSPLNCCVLVDGVDD